MLIISSTFDTVLRKLTNSIDERKGSKVMIQESTVLAFDIYKVMKYRKILIKYNVYSKSYILHVKIRG